MEQFYKKKSEDTISGVIDRGAVDRIIELAQQPNAYTLNVFKIAEQTSRSVQDMELFLKLRKSNAEKKASKSP